MSESTGASWVARTDKPNAGHAAATELLAALHDGDVMAALTGNETRRGHRFEEYLLAGPNAPGQKLLRDYSEGKPVPEFELRDLLMGMRTALGEYPKKFYQLPANSSDYEMMQPDNGATPYFVQQVDAPRRRTDFATLDGVESAPQKLIAQPDIHYLDERLKRQLDSKIEDVMHLNALVLGNMQGLAR